MQDFPWTQLQNGSGKNSVNLLPVNFTSKVGLSKLASQYVAQKRKLAYVIKDKLDYRHSTWLDR